MSDAPNDGNGIDPEWVRLTELLRQQRGQLVEEFTQQFHEKINYAPGLVQDQDISDTAELTMSRYCALLAGEKLTELSRRHPRRVGIRRARQGVPLDELQRATRLSFLVLWSALERIAGVDGAQLLVANMDRILNSVESYLSSVQSAFLVEHARLRNDRKLMRTRLLSRLFHSPALTADGVKELAEELNLAEHAEYELLAVRGEHMATAEDRFEHQRDVFQYESGGALMFFRQQNEEKNWACEVPGFSGGHVRDIQGLRKLGDAAHSVSILLQYGAKGKLATLQNSWPLLAAVELDRIMPEFRESILQPLNTCTAAERERLLLTLKRFAESGSIKATSELLFCHRNTVVQRLQAFTSLTGIDLSVPSQSAWAVVALSRELDNI